MRTHIIAILPALTAIVCLACSNGNSGKLVQDAATDAPRVEDQADRGEVCSPECGDRVCGPDGCGGQCGQCEMIKEVCSAEGQCVPAPCQSSLDCLSNLVCDKPSGECVICVGDEDCPEGTSCGADHECHKPIACESDKDCKYLEMVCDKELGLCVQCLGPEECPAEEYCLGGYCLADECVAGEATCVGGSVEACAGDGSAWNVKEVCGVNQHCLEAACHDNVCPPGESYCDNGIAKTCDSLGSAVTAEEDCKAQDLNCYDGSCSDSVCPANETFCIDGFTAAACAADGMSFTSAACPAKEYCDSGTCHDQICDPSSTFCEENKVTICNSKGSAIQSKTDCGDLVCVAGGCYELVCTPAALYCDGKALMECDANGTATNLAQNCGENQYCGENGDTASCQDQVCTPEALSCDGTTIVQCDDLGASWLPGDNCANNDNGCLDGECVKEFCGDGIKQEGEECDDGNDVLCDGCEQCMATAQLDLTEDHAVACTVVATPSQASWTVETWVRFDKYPPQQGAAHIVGRTTKFPADGAASFTQTIYARWMDAQDGIPAGFRFRAKYEDALDVDHLVVSKALIELHVWYHVAYVRSEEGKHSIFVNGHLSGTGTASEDPHNASGITCVGDIAAPTDHISPRGNVDEIRISKVARYEGDFVPLRRHGVDPDTVALWHFDAEEGDVTEDATANAYDLLLAAGASLTDDDCYGESNDAVVCGDGEVAIWEECDDGNVVNGDGCSSDCEI